MSDRLTQTPSATLSNLPPFDKGDTAEPRDVPLSWGELIASCAVIAALAIGATFGTSQSESIGEAMAAEAMAATAFASSPRQVEVPAIEAVKIVPADPLRKDLSWSPLTGDGSNRMKR